MKDFKFIETSIQGLRVYECIMCEERFTDVSVKSLRKWHTHQESDDFMDSFGLNEVSGFEGKYIKNDFFLKMKDGTYKSMNSLSYENDHKNEKFIILTTKQMKNKKLKNAFISGGIKILEEKL